MTINPAEGHDGLQVVAPGGRLTQPFDDGLQHVPYSDKQVTQPNKSLFGYPGSNDIYVYEKGIERDNDGGNLAGTKEKRYFGLRRRVFWGLFAILLIVIIVAAVGGGVGGSLSHKSTEDASSNGTSQSSTTSSSGSSSATSTSSSARPNSSSSSSSSSKTLTSSAPAATATTITASGMGAYDCPAENGTTYTSSLYPDTFEILCNSDWPEGVEGINGGVVTDLNTGVVATSIQACIDQCAANNAGGGLCNAVAYGANITLALSRGGITGNCFMKSQRGAQVTIDDSGQVIGAYLVSS